MNGKVCLFILAAPLLGVSQGTESHWIQRAWSRAAMHNDPGQITMATHTLLCFDPVLRTPPFSCSCGPSDELLSSLSVLGMRCGLTGLWRTTGNCPVFLLCDSKSSKQPSAAPVFNYTTHPFSFPSYHFVFCIIFSVLADGGVYVLMKTEGKYSILSHLTKKKNNTHNPNVKLPIEQLYNWTAQAQIYLLSALQCYG